MTAPTSGQESPHLLTECPDFWEINKRQPGGEDHALEVDPASQETATRMESEENRVEVEVWIHSNLLRNIPF